MKFALAHVDLQQQQKKLTAAAAAETTTKANTIDQDHGCLIYTAFEP